MQAAYRYQLGVNSGRYRAVVRTPTRCTVKIAVKCPIFYSMAGAEQEVILGIDFGTSYTSAAAYIDGRLQFLLDGGDRTIPTVVHVPLQGRPLIGRPALGMMLREPASTITSVKRLMGRTVNDREVKRLDAGVGFRIEPGPDQMALLAIGEDLYSPTQIAGYVFARLRDLARERFRARVTKAIVTVPVAATPAYCQAIRQAARFAHIEILQMVPEPVAGCLALGLHEEPCQRRLAICDFGGGTFDVTLMTQNQLHFESLAVAGDDLLGGDDFDFELAEAVAGHIFKSTRVDLHRDAVKWQELLFRCESIKRQLSSSPQATLAMKDAYVLRGERQNLRLLVDRAWVEPRWQTLVERSVSVLQRLLVAADKSKDEVDEVVLIGGTTLMPVVRKLISNFFGKKLRTTEYADVAVTIGAALQTVAHSRVCTQTPSLSTGT